MATLRSHGWVRVGAVGSAAAVAAVLTLALLDGPAHAATTIITVTGLGDDAAPGVSCSPSSCPTLRDAVFTANAMTTNSTNPVEIDLPAGTITLTNGILTIGSTTNLNVTVKGATAGSPSGSTIDQTTASSGVFVTPGLFANEVANFTDLTIEGGDAGGFGGGALQGGAASLSAAGEATTITDCAFLNNTATIGGAIAFSGGGDLTVVNSTFTNNSSTAGGGGGILYQVNSSATEGPSNLSISGSTFSGNSANSIVNGGADGGGVSFQGGGPAVGSLSITTSVFSGNSAGQSSAGSGQGGGLFVIDQNGSNVDSVALSTFVNNTANNGTVGNTIPQGQGGGVYSNAALFSLGDSRLVSNTATDGPSLWQGTSGVNDQSTATDDWWGVNTGPGANAATGGTAGSLTTSPWLQLRDLSSVGTVAPNGSTTFTADLLGLSTGGSLASGSLNGLASFPSSPGVFSNAVDGTPTSTSVQFVNGSATTAFAAGTTLGTNAGHIDAVADGQTTTGDVNVKADSTTSVSTSGTPSVFGQGVTFTATLSSQVTGTTPSLPQGGTVTFFIDAIPNSPVPVSNGSADLVVSNLNVGPHLVQALYSGDTDFNASSGLLAGNQTVNPSDTLTTVSSSLNPSAAGQSVTFSATVTAVAPGAGTPGGSVQFEDGGNPIGSPATLDGSGVASVSSSSLGVATHTITAAYGGSFDFNASTGTLSPDQVVNAAPTTLSLTSSVNSSVFGEGVSFTASVTATSSGTPGGSVQFGIDGADVGTTQTLVAGQASSDSITDLAVGSHTVTATYTPSDGVHASSSGTLAGGQAVVQANSTTLVSSDNNPSFPGAPVDFTATVTALSPGAGTPTGNVQFVIDGSNFGAVQSLSGGVATLGGVTSLGLGTHPVVADYLGDTNFVTSTSSALSQQVNGFATTTTVTSSLTPSVFGQPVSFTATVDAGANGTPTGSVQFGIDGANVGSAVTLSGGSASSADLSNLAVGTHVVTATYAPGT
ncbi:MAG TPA: Ig-like domain-containing protein, partial [Actinomycetota bacterium]|nr:Ig-like domain-containing protein [Actinomycetota bacterium]